MTLPMLEHERQNLLQTYALELSGGDHALLKTHVIFIPFVCLSCSRSLHPLRATHRLQAGRATSSCASSACQGSKLMGEAACYRISRKEAGETPADVMRDNTRHGRKLPRNTKEEPCGIPIPWHIVKRRRG